MNENVTIKTPKRRRWIARLLVSALCILLASSLLFVGVVADVGVLSLVTSSSVILPVSTSVCVPLDFDFFVFMSSNTLYFYRDDFLISQYYIPDSVSGYFPPSGTDNGTYALAFDDLNSILYAVSQYGTQFRIITLVIRDYQVVSSSFAAYGGLMNVEYFVPPLAVHNRHLYFIDNFNNFYHFYNGDLDNLGFVSNISWLGSAALRFAGSCYVDGYCYFPDASVIVDVNGDFSAVCPQHPIFTVDGLACYVLGNFIRSIDPVSGSSSAIYEFYDFSWPGHFFGFSNSSTLTLITRESGTKTYHSGIFTFPSSPPESSDETTTEPPPESSEESSEPDDSFTKIWKVDRGFSESYAGSIDLTNATKIRAFLGVFTSTGSMFFSDRAVPLTIEVYRDGSDSPDTYKFDFYAYGWSVSDSSVAPNSYDSYTFPDVVGRYYEIPIPLDGEDLYFPTFAPYGSIYILLSDSSYPYGIKRVTFNLHNPQGYLDVNFISSSSTSFTIYNDDLTKGITYTFDSGTYGYQSFYNDEGESYESIVYVPQVGSSVKFFADDVLETGMYSLHVYNSQSVFLPWSDDEYNNAISKFDQVSLDMELLESKANEAYGQFSFDSMVAEDFLGAVSDFNSIKDSSGGSFILDYIFGMWTIHPFASSMIAVVGTLAIIGFIIRKL